jgi:hypothetical protein
MMNSTCHFDVKNDLAVKQKQHSSPREHHTNRYLNKNHSRNRHPSKASRRDKRHKQSRRIAIRRSPRRKRTRCKDRPDRGPHRRSLPPLHNVQIQINVSESAGIRPKVILSKVMRPKEEYIQR